MPDAPLKLYLVASAEERARRRYQETLERDGRASYKNILAIIRKRDKIDSTRSVAPLRPALNAITLDTGRLDAQQVFEAALALVEKYGKADE
jgi:cytidylate kinase